MEFRKTIGHDFAKEIMINAFSNNRLPSAYLLVGEAGIGKRTLVEEYSQLLNCDTHVSCGTCPNCRLFQSDNHPDFLRIEPSGKFIKISQIHDLIDELSLRPVYAKKRTVLIRGAHRMNHESANSFLKILEEPPLNTILFLTTHDENLLLETIVSRCQSVRTPALEPNQIREILKQQYPLEGTELEFVLSFSRGRIREDYISNAAVLMAMNRQVLNLMQTLHTEHMVSHSALLDSWAKKDYHGYFLEFCIHWLKDFLYLKTNQPGLITNTGLINEIDRRSLPFSVEQLQWAFDLAIETELAIQSNAAKSLAMESLVIQLKQIREGAVVV